MSKSRFGTQQKHKVGERWLFELSIHNTGEELMSLKMIDCIQAVTNSELQPWTSDSLEGALRLLITWNLRNKRPYWSFPLVLSPLMFMSKCSILIWSWEYDCLNHRSINHILHGPKKGGEEGRFGFWKPHLGDFRSLSLKKLYRIFGTRVFHIL